MAINQQLIDYAKRSLQKGVPVEKIRQNLISSGWSEGEINDALNLAQKEMQLNESKQQEAQLKNQQLLDYATKSLKRGVPAERIRQSLISSGWSEGEINEALNKAKPLISSPQIRPQTTAVKNFNEKPFYEEEKKKPLVLWLIISILGVLIIGGILILFLNSGEEKSCENGEACENGAICVDGKCIKEEKIECSENNQCTEGNICVDGKCIKKSIVPVPSPSGSPSPTATPRGGDVGGGGGGGGSGGGGGGGGSGEGPSGGDSNIKDYGTNFETFATSSNTCSLSKVKHVYTTNLFNVTRTTETSYELKGLDGDKCIFYLKTANITVKYDDTLRQETLNSGITPESIQQRENVENIEANKSEGKDGTCKIKPEDLSNVLKIWNSDSLQVGTFPEDVWTYAGCTGSYFS